MIKKVVMYTNPDDPTCGEIESFLEEQEIDLQLHNVVTSPLSLYQVSDILKNFNMEHFLNSGPKSFRDNGFDKAIPERKKVIELIAKDNSLLRLPVIVAGRLMTIGSNKKRIKEMLQINSNGSEAAGKTKKQDK